MGIVHVGNDVMVESDLLCFPRGVLDDICTAIDLDFDRFQLKGTPFTICIAFNTNQCPIMLNRGLKASIRVQFKVHRFDIASRSILLIIELNNSRLYFIYCTEYMMIGEEPVVSNEEASTIGMI